MLDDVPEIFYFDGEERALSYLERDTHILQTCQKIVDMPDMGFN